MKKTLLLLLPPATCEIKKKEKGTYCTQILLSSMRGNLFANNPFCEINILNYNFDNCFKKKQNMRLYLYDKYYIMISGKKKKRPPRTVDPSGTEYSSPPVPLIFLFLGVLFPVIIIRIPCRLLIPARGGGENRRRRYYLTKVLQFHCCHSHHHRYTRLLFVIQIDVPHIVFHHSRNCTMSNRIVDMSSFVLSVRRLTTRLVHCHSNCTSRRYQDYSICPSLRHCCHKYLYIGILLLAHRR